MSELDLIATTTFGLEALVAREIKDLGYDQVTVENGKVTFTADESAICRANLWLRTADRIRLKIGEFGATTFDELFEQTKVLPWPDLLPGNAAFPVDGKSVQSTLFSISDCQAIVKKAVVESMKKHYRTEWFREDGPLYRIEVSLLRNVATLTIDTSGPGLHKRGYRVTGSKAPLRETLAAALVLIARWQPGIPLIDPLCGSGTIPIEAALIGQNIAPGMNRTFVAEQWPAIPREMWFAARKEAHERANYTRKLDLSGTDIDGKLIQIARKNAAEAGVEDAIHFQVRPLAELSSRKKYGKIICNPPYGERLGSQKEVEQLYREMGRLFKTLDTWSWYTLTAQENFEQLFGKKATKRRKLYHGNIKVQYYQYF
ncbi:MAG TPA: class I SAM-dependent RNA methyltransferase [Candidatus Limnocylindrales bacterium]|nr:class I SAM-dependent RNA methyltransferase [Candidatus Limnocylindrales bacterium]